MKTNKSLVKRKTQEEQTKIMELVQLENDEVQLISTRISGGIALYFHCATLQGLVHLYQLMCSGRLKTIVEAAFNEVLRSCDAATFTTMNDPIGDPDVYTVQWPIDDYNKCKTFLQGKTKLCAPLKSFSTRITNRWHG